MECLTAASNSRNITSRRIVKNWHTLSGSVFMSRLSIWCWISRRSAPEKKTVKKNYNTGDAPAASEWSTILLPTKVCLLSSTWREFDPDTAYEVCISVSIGFPHMVSISLGFPYMVRLQTFKRKWPAVGPAGVDFPPDVCLTVSCNHKVFLSYQRFDYSIFKWVAMICIKRLSARIVVLVMATRATCPIPFISYLCLQCLPSRRIQTPPSWCPAERGSSPCVSEHTDTAACHAGQTRYEGSEWGLAGSSGHPWS